MDQRIRVKGRGTFTLGGTKQALTWSADVSVSELKAYLDGGPSEAIESAKWRLDDERVVQETYLRLDLPKSRKSSAKDASLIARHPDGRWMSAKKLVALLAPDDGDSSSMGNPEIGVGEPAMQMSSAADASESVSEPDSGSEPPIGDPPG